MTKKSSLLPILLQQSRRRVIWSGWKLVIILSMGLCVFALFRIHLSSPPETLLSRRRSFSREVVFSGPPKIAFLFLVRRGLPLDFLWGSFLEVIKKKNDNLLIFFLNFDLNFLSFLSLSRESWWNLGIGFLFLVCDLIFLSLSLESN